jgi:NAD(P)-dependent dehydrogenase (short-subunit alcohol dehydrogenase family)
MIEERGGRALPVVGDIMELDQAEACVARTAEHFGRLDIVVNNAQLYPRGKLLEVTDADAYDAWRSGPLATFRFMRFAYPHLKAAGGGTFINVGSGAMLMHEGLNFGLYIAAKEATLAFTRAAAVEWGKDNIRAIFVMPSAWTPMTEESFRKRGQPKIPEGGLRWPIPRWGEPEADVGRPIAWLCSEEAGYITGSIFMLDGGGMYLH